MGHIIDEIILYLRISLLTENDYYREDKCNKQDQSENDTWNHESHTGEDIAVHIREMNLNHPHLRLRIITEKQLRITILLTFLRIVRTPVNFTTILSSYRKMIRNINAIIHHLSLQVLVQLLEIDSLLQRLI